MYSNAERHFKNPFTPIKRLNIMILGRHLFGTDELTTIRNTYIVPLIYELMGRARAHFVSVCCYIIYIFYYEFVYANTTNV